MKNNLFWSNARLDLAEIIGSKPKPLALSLYQELITDHIWAQNRSNYGYKELDQFHLMTTFAERLMLIYELILTLGYRKT